MIRSAAQELVNLRLALIALATLVAVGCGQGPSSETPETLDTVHLRLDFGGGVTLTSVDYVLKGPGSFKRTGTLTVGDDPTVSGTFQNLPAAAYDVVVQGTASDDASLCKGEVMFTVSAMMNVVVPIPLTCSGRAAVAADVNTCPLIDSLSAVPAEVFVGSAIHLVAETHDPDSGPSPITATWASSSGTLGGLSPTGATFTCTAPGTFMISLKISDGTPGNKCADTASLAVTCTGGP
jgi:hypothetical protein